MQLTIGKLAGKTGLSADTIRYYEKMGLITPLERSRAGYRLYSPDTARVIRFIKGAKSLNFTLDEIRKLLVLDSSDRATCAEILKTTENKINEAETKIADLREIVEVLQKLIKKCPGDGTSTSECPILDHLHKSFAVVFMLASFLLFTPNQAFAKPISYVGGTMMMQENDETGNTLSIDYTVTPNYAVGLYAKRENGGVEYNTVGPQINTLIKRWNLPEGQGNIFNMTGAGVSEYHDTVNPSAWTGFLGDYETRRIFTSYEARLMYVNNVETSLWQRARVGFAPYKANYDEINTWFMLQADYHPKKDGTFIITPLVRFFYHATLLEAGYSSNDHVMFNWILQF